MSKRNGFMLYHDDVHALDILTDAQVGRLIRLLARYSEGEDVDPGDLLMPFAFMSQKVDRDGERYERIVEKRKTAAQKRWDDDASDANACK